MSLFRGEIDEMLAGFFGINQYDLTQPAIKLSPIVGNSASEVLLINRSDFNRANGQAGVRATVSARTTALTGNAFGVRGRAQNDVLTSTGKIVGGEFAAANNQTSASLTAHGADIFALAKGKNTATLRGAEIQADNTEGTGTITTMVGCRVRVVGAGTITNGPWGVEVFNDSETASAAPKPLKAFIRCASAVVTTVCSCVVDATDTRINGAALFGVTLTTDDNVLFYYKDKDGTAHAVVASDADALAIRS